MFAYDLADNEDEIDELAAGAWEGAACRDSSGALTALFFSDDEIEIQVAKAICNSCALRAPCLRGALARREPAGVWGGQLFADGEVIARKRKRGRPPKVAAGMPTGPVLVPREQGAGQHCTQFLPSRLKSA